MDSPTSLPPIQGSPPTTVPSTSSNALTSSSLAQQLNEDDKVWVEKMLKLGVHPDSVASVLIKKLLAREKESKTSVGTMMKTMMEQLEAGEQPRRRPEAVMQKFEGLGMFPRYKRETTPDQALQAFSKIKHFGAAWLDASDSAWTGAVFHGGLGCCKTSVALLFGHMFFDAGRHVKAEIASVAIDSFKDLIRAGENSETSLKAHMNNYLKPDLLILDDFGIQSRTDYEMIEFYKMMGQRYNLLKPTIITTNFDLDTERDEKIFQDCISPQVADRLKDYFIDADQWGGNVRG